MNLFKALAEFFQMIFSPRGTLERPSPKIRIKPEQLHIREGTLTVTDLTGCFLAGIEPSNSMETGIDDGMYVLLDPTVPHQDLIVGDIIYYEHPEFRAIHRIVEIGSDPVWFCRCKGDNNATADLVKVRVEHLEGVWRATLN